MRLTTTLFIALLGTLAACDGGGGEETTPCEEGSVSCDGDFLVECVDGEELETDCAADGMECHEEMGHCMDMGGDM